MIRWLFKTQFGLAANAIRDDEDKAEAMGIPTLRYKQVGWAIAAFFMGCTGAVFGNMVGISSHLKWRSQLPHLVSLWWQCRFLAAKAPCGVQSLARSCFMSSKRQLGHICWDLQWVVLGLILIVNIVYFQQGIMGWLQTKYPEKFGIIVDQSNIQAKEEA